MRKKPNPFATVKNLDSTRRSATTHAAKFIQTSLVDVAPTKAEYANALGIKCFSQSYSRIMNVEGWETIFYAFRFDAEGLKKAGDDFFWPLFTMVANKVFQAASDLEDSVVT